MSDESISAPATATFETASIGSEASAGSEVSDDSGVTADSVPPTDVEALGNSQEVLQTRQDEDAERVERDL